MKLNFKILETNENSLFFSTNLKLAKTKNKYLEANIQLLKKTIINLCNPYNLNYWIKLFDIIMENISIILKKKSSTFFKNRHLPILETIDSIVNDMEIKENIKKYIFRQFKSEKENFKEGIQQENASLMEKEKEHIIDFISINYLFNSSGKGNQIYSFAEVILNFILFNDLNITEENIKELKEVKIKETKNKCEKEIKIEEETFKGKIKINRSIKGELKIKKSIKEKLEYEKPIKKENNNEIRYKKIYLNIKSKEEKNFKANKLFEFPFHYNKDIIKKKNSFDLIYEKIDFIIKELGYNGNEEEISELKNDYKYLFYKIKELMKIIEIDIKKNWDIDIKELSFEKVKKIFKVDNLDSNLKEKINIYLDLKELDLKVTNKKIFYEEKNKELFELIELIKKNEKLINDYINQIQAQIKKIPAVKKISNILHKYKMELKIFNMNKLE